MKYQQRAFRWVLDCFGYEVAYSKKDRCDRFAEEAVELLQSLGYTRHEMMNAVHFTYGRPVGDPSQEMGGVVHTLAALAEVFGLDLEQDAETELRRIDSPAAMTRIAEKQLLKFRF